MSKRSGKLELNQPRPGGETPTENGTEVVHRVHVLLTDDLEEVTSSQGQGHAGHGDHGVVKEGWSWGALIEVLSRVYALLLTCLSIVLPLTLFLDSSLNYHENGAYLSVFHFYVYLVALGVIVYMMISGRKMSKEGKVTHLTMGTRPPKEGEDGPPLYEGIEEVNFFLRMGLVAFSIGGCLMEGFRVMAYADNDSARMWNCFGRSYLVLSIIRMFFFVMQTYSLFKYHRIVINFHHTINKFCTMHLIATNMCTWCVTVILEAVESYHHAEALNSGHHKRAAPAVEDHGTSNHTGSHGEIANQCAGFPNTLSSIAAPYIFPFIIEYSLLAAAILYNINSRIGPAEYHELLELLEEKEQEIKEKDKEPGQANQTLFHGENCSKAHSGLFSGLFILSILSVAVCFFLYFKSSAGSPTYTTGMIHVISDIVVNVITGVAVIFAFMKTRKLFFSAHLESMLDQNLLILALFGYYILLVSMAIASLSQTNRPGLYGEGARLMGTMAIIDIIQITMQVVFIVDGLRRKSITDDHAKNKPGRSLVTFLLILNLGLWIVNTFMLKESYAFSIFNEYYGDLAWITILNVCLPLAIYFRFHAAVCLSEMWMHTYQKVSMHRIIKTNMGNRGKIL